MATVEGAQPEWRRSSACLPGECLEAATHQGYVLIRDSANPPGTVLTFTTDQWRGFAQGICCLPTAGQESPRAESLCSAQSAYLPTHSRLPGPGAVHRVPMRGDHGMNGNEWRGSGLAMLADDREVSRHRRQRPDLFAYCAVSGVLGTATATVMSLATSGVTRLVVWAAVLSSVSLLAGLGYDSGPVNFVWSACLPSRRRDS